MSWFRMFKQSSDTPALAELLEMLKNDAALIDVRTVPEFNEGHVKNSRNIPLDELNATMPALDKKKTYVLVCASGIRSEAAADRLRKAGFESVYNGGSWSTFI